MCAGLLFGLSASFAKPVIEDLHVSVGDAAGAWQTWALLGFGFAGFVIQQLSLATGQLAPAMAAVSVANPAVSVILGIVLFDERLTRPAWHVVVAFAALVAALAGAVLITLANRETPMPGVDAAATRAASRRPGARVIIEVFVLALAMHGAPDEPRGGLRARHARHPAPADVGVRDRGPHVHARLRRDRRRRHGGDPRPLRHEQDEGHRRLRRRPRGAGVRRRISRPGASTEAVPDDAPRPPGRMRAVLDRRLTVRTAALAGPATHIPGLFYLIALNLIVTHNAAVADKAVALVTYNAVWFALPLAALVVCIVRPARRRSSSRRSSSGPGPMPAASSSRSLRRGRRADRPRHPLALRRGHPARVIPARPGAEERFSAVADAIGQVLAFAVGVFAESACR